MERLLAAATPQAGEGVIDVSSVLVVLVGFCALVVLAYIVGVVTDRGRATLFGIGVGAAGELVRGLVVVRDRSPLALGLTIVGGLLLGALVGGVAGLIGGSLAHRQKG